MSLIVVAEIVIVGNAIMLGVLMKTYARILTHVQKKFGVCDVKELKEDVFPDDSKFYLYLFKQIDYMACIIIILVGLNVALFVSQL